MADPKHGDPQIDAAAIAESNSLSETLNNPNILKNLSDETLTAIGNSLSGLVRNIDNYRLVRMRQSIGGFKGAIRKQQKNQQKV